ncbi:hypothetical protein SEA_BARSTEN_73 [Gordonia Phage Barsten]|uniref:Uncharacterized protein n=2 Tax=Vividuovirus TaxID=2560251 RepID=A0A7G8LE05_9CAUD|nr:hypothetical protein KNV14_gp73 [Gordonia Phage Barsten]YP_010109528.1 hypothetical protein KNV17_gp74 [Gordonia phage Paries]QKY78428.1 hypothetical protein SEA_BARSTEN_73 [Gordonia Phage Barsten]QNJ55477.1 hypothetical protein SEA_PARIES_74 [Gordonia phage Paries]
MTEPILWVIRYSVEPLDPRNTSGVPELSVMRVVDPMNADPDDTHEVILAPSTATGVLLIDPADAGSLAFVTAAQLVPRFSTDRPVLLLQATHVSATVAKPWPLHYQSLDPADPLAGMAAHVNTDTPDVKVAWIEGHLFGDGDVTVVDLLGGPTDG